FKRARAVGNDKHMAPYRSAEVLPGPQVRTDDEIDAYVRRSVLTAHHPAGTCRMGTAAPAVVDPQRGGRGAEPRRVVDASAMPDLVSAHINACVLMMGEKASDVIRGNR